jgi:uncharacterized protein
MDWFALDQDIMARDVRADVRLTRINGGVLASGTAQGVAMIECVRCLDVYEQVFEAEFDQEYRPTIDVRSGLAVEQPGLEEEIGAIDDLHQLDLTEPIRQVGIVALPIKPVCRDDCPGLPEQADQAVEGGDVRFEALVRLLNNGPVTDET